ncbi:MAG: cobalt-precorrin 5A hydrolase [Cetobacterium somerae]|uniref:cobalt-precorrin 5A hydrolase n=1 Tax=Cetobacterium TaxID=180162 RepID=UPI00163CEA0D|nr:MULTISPECIES: cobalt-precorrin 5A hydrolase [Cetobacterium]MBC2854810.1 cobalt-precorrin 5A hydrolase [Cetobacterium sp. 2G large]MCQ9627661.1 cobalt-precorrin 5A hydrolase [Cetobacterium somerae]WVJ02544.1 cobalt-precorrin 5A hydrolase [Cetobacterium somerae]
MKLAVWTVTRGAGLNGVEIKNKIEGIDVFTLSKFKIDNSIQMENFTEELNEAFNKYDGHIFIMATGIVIRKIASLIKSKDVDPAVVVIDEGMNFVISLLSGHLGGANDLTQNLHEIFGLVPIITTSSDVTGKIAVDTLSQKLKCNLKSLEAAKKVTSLIVDGKNVELSLPKNICNENPEGVVVISNKENLEVVHLYPENLVIGIGSRRGIEKEKVYEFLIETLEKHNLSLKSIKHFATVDLKADEKGIVETARELGKELKIVSREEILTVEDMFHGSEFVKKEIGVKAVSEPCAYLTSSKDGKFIEIKAKKDGMTISIYEERFIYEKR